MRKLATVIAVVLSLFATNAVAQGGNDGGGGPPPPVITWPTPTAITYGTALSAAQLDATATLSGAPAIGTFAYTPAAGTIPAAGIVTLNVTFTQSPFGVGPNGYGSVNLTVNQATPVVTWATPAAIIYGTALSATQLNATASVPGTFVYSPSSGTVPAGGTDTLSVTFTPTDTTDYTTVTKTVSLTVGKTTPVITWPTPAAIAYGTTLSATQLDATASVAGTFVYSPAIGSEPALGTDTLSVTFTPTNTTDYTTANKSITLVVGKATPLITWATPAPIAYGTALSSTQLDATTTIAGTFVYLPAAGTVPTLGTDTLSVTFTPTNTTDYTTATETVNVTVGKVTPTITWSTPASIVYGTTLSGTQLDATTSVAGTFAYTPAVGTLPAAGTDTLSVTFTPTNTTDYATATQSVSLTVSKAIPVITWPTPEAIQYGTALSRTQLNAVVSSPTASSNANILAPVSVQGVPALVLSTAPLPAGALQSCTTDYASAPPLGQSLTFVIFNSNGNGSYTIANSFNVVAAPVAGLQTFASPPLTITAGQVVGYWAPSGTEPGYGGQSVGGYYINNEATLPSGPHTFSSYSGGYPVSCTVAPGQLTYSSSVGTVLPVGTTALSVTFTPTNTSDYMTTTQTVNLAVSSGPPACVVGN